MKSFLKIVTLVFVSGFISTQAKAGSFDEGSVTATVAFGSGQFFNEDYLIIGAGAGYYITDGVEVGLDFDAWTGGEPSIYEITPKLSYVYDNPSDVKPYIGVFYNRTFIEDRSDSDAIGYRAGMYTPVGSKTLIGFGLVRTELQDCTETIFNDCSETYTELSVIFKL